ncbi:MAG: adenylate/guanylate cyclase domain-containing protein [Candidatus Wallbacteria bacterium]|nr:adenylate/guanylate cyclase domain-containing protein [Candidatus Wallbacteria bacterium]
MEQLLWVLILMAACGITAAVTAHLTEGKSRRRSIEEAFGRFLHPDIVLRVADNPDRFLSGELREITILFTDLEGFTTISEKADPATLFSVLSLYMDSMTEVIMQSGGTVDKYIGDALMAFWGAPCDQPDQAERACGSILDMIARMPEVNKLVEARGFPPLKMRAGIYTGQAMVGGAGTRHTCYTAIGDTVNLAARMEPLNKKYDTLIIVGEPTMKAAGNRFRFRHLDSVEVKGRKEAVDIYELTGRAESA